MRICEYVMFFVGSHDLLFLLCNVAEVLSHCHVALKPHLKRAFLIKGNNCHCLIKIMKATTFGCTYNQNKNIVSTL